jgi:hypothetical protein
VCNRTLPFDVHNVNSAHMKAYWPIFVNRYFQDI